MKQGYIMVGVPGAGKSTHISKIIEAAKEEQASVKVFSLDTCRLSFVDQHYWNKPVTPEVYATAFEAANKDTKAFDAYVSWMWKMALEADVVVVDNTNLTRKSRARWVQDLRAKKYGVVAVNVMVPLELAIARQKTRGDKIVPESVVRDMYMRQQEVLVPAEADRIVHVHGF